MLQNRQRRVGRAVFNLLQIAQADVAKIGQLAAQQPPFITPAAQAVAHVAKFFTDLFMVRLLIAVRHLHPSAKKCNGGRGF